MDLNFVAQKTDVVLLDNDETYCVINQTLYENESYLLLKKVSDDLAEYFNPKNKTYKVVKEIVESETEYSLEQVEDKELLKVLIAKMRHKA